MMKAWLCGAALAALSAGVAASGAQAQLLITGNDEKVSFDADGKRVIQAPGKDTVSVIDIHDRVKPKIVANLPLMNTIAGPPVNLAISHDQRLALVANSLDWPANGDSWKDNVPDNKLYVIDLTVKPPAQIATVELGKQPSGLAINSAGTLALVADFADDAVSVLAIDGMNVKVADTVSVAAPGDKPAPTKPTAVAITPDGKRALVTLSAANQVALLDIDGTKVTPVQVGGKPYVMTTGLRPLNIQITPDGKLALVNDIGGGQDGQVDSVAVIDLTQNPPRVIDQVAVGDGPEGLAMSPAGGYAASLILNGTGGVPKDAFYRHAHSYVALLKITGKTVRKVSETEVGGLAEGIAFSPDGRFLYVGNFVDGNIDILRLAGDSLKKVGSLAVPGHPASMRGSTP
jgi:DNA-binding beta-propeller fold protein YncE